MPKAQTIATRERIFAAAERLFAEQGFQGVSMPTLAEAAGITAGAIYKHFESKADLFFEVVRHAVATTPVTSASAASLPQLVAAYTTRRLKLIRQLAIETHYTAAKDAKVGRLLRRSLDLQMADVRTAIEAGQAAGQLDPAIDAKLLACAVFVFIMGLMHSETLTPQLVGEAAWRDFVQDRIAVLIGAARPTSV